MTLFRVEKSKGQEIAFWPPWTAEPWPDSGTRGESLKVDSKKMVSIMNMESGTRVENLGEERDTGRNRWGNVEKSYLNPNFIPLGSRQKTLNKGFNNWQNTDCRGLNGADCENGLMDLLLDKENDPLLTMEGKK
ncbi:hypothetical protein Goklo_027166 [Gossypium klotzschianum]|uniref:Uncharacterized protein n=1 Tax=Gossypium klotzschianum TaxID=34286 RepID=A0A7J8TXF5_9ROSI|nr:hypothetical protein [Gossypium klotzschianum]